MLPFDDCNEGKSTESKEVHVLKRSSLAMNSHSATLESTVRTVCMMDKSRGCRVLCTLGCKVRLTEVIDVAK